MMVRQHPCFSTLPDPGALTDPLVRSVPCLKGSPGIVGAALFFASRLSLTSLGVHATYELSFSLDRYLRIASVVRGLCLYSVMVWLRLPWRLHTASRRNATK